MECNECLSGHGLEVSVYKEVMVHNRRDFSGVF